jgi:hypothetical protein
LKASLAVTGRMETNPPKKTTTTEIKKRIHFIIDYNLHSLTGDNLVIFYTTSFEVSRGSPKKSLELSSSFNSRALTSTIHQLPSSEKRVKL